MCAATADGRCRACEARFHGLAEVCDFNIYEMCANGFSVFDLGSQTVSVSSPSVLHVVRHDRQKGILSVVFTLFP